VEPVCRSVGVGDAAADTGFISGVDPQPIATGFAQDVELSFVEPEFMSAYLATFGDECVEDSADDQPVPELSNRDKALLQQACFFPDDVLLYAPSVSSNLICNSIKTC
jgi:hypothetical protein